MTEAWDVGVLQHGQIYPRGLNIKTYNYAPLVRDGLFAVVVHLSHPQTNGSNRPRVSRSHLVHNPVQFFRGGHGWMIHRLEALPDSAALT